MDLPVVAEKWSGKVNTVAIGATKENGGTRSRAVTVGGRASVPFMDFDGSAGNKIVIAMDVLDVVPPDWPAPLVEAWGNVLGNPAAWAKKAVEEFGADLICIKLDGIHRDKGDKGPEDAVKVVSAVKEAVGVPLIVWGSDDDEKDNAVMPKVSQALKGERALLGCAKEQNYKVLTAVCLADGHNIIGLAPLDINIGKQVNILLSDMEFPLDRIVMFQTTGALGYGLEYAYSIQEREMLAALQGDKMMAMPVICDIGYESWRAKEAKAADAELPGWGPHAERGVIWEATTAMALAQSGCDILRMRHPKAVAEVKKGLAKLYA
ncbi:MAG: acetyl-CoA decarbonylase/synthase complex subunit delta [Planctomycetota bacterium]